MTLREWLLVGAVLGLLGGVMRGAAAVTKADDASPEGARKLVHVTLGLACLSFPWLFERSLPVWVLAGLATLPLLLLRTVPRLRTGAGRVLHGVARPSYGEVLFAPAVATVFQLAEGEAVLFVVPVAILTLADTAGALAGTRWGRNHYQCGGGRKSVEGSLGFACAAFLCVFVPLGMSGVEPGRAGWIALILAVLTMMGEGISDRGFDNLLLPLGGFLVLRQLIELPEAALITRSATVLLLLGIVTIASRFSTLHGNALLAAALLGYGCAVLADFRFVLPLLAIFVCHVMTSRRHHLAQLTGHRIDVVVSHAVPALGWVIPVALGRLDPAVGLAGLSSTMAVQLAIATSVTRVWLGGKPAVFLATVKGWGIAGAAGLLWIPSLVVAGWWGFLPALLATPALCYGFAWMERHNPRHQVAPWILRGCLSLLVSLPIGWVRA